MNPKRLLRQAFEVAILVALLTGCARNFLGAMPLTPVVHYPQVSLIELRVRLDMPPAFSNYVFEQQMGLQLIRFQLAGTLARSAEEMARSIFREVVTDPLDTRPVAAVLTPRVTAMLWSGGAGAPTQTVIEWRFLDPAGSLIWKNASQGVGHFFGPDKADMFVEVFTESFQAIATSREIRRYAESFNEATARSQPRVSAD